MISNIGLNLTGNSSTLCNNLRVNFMLCAMQEVLLELVLYRVKSQF
ncbi:hypothetical protein VCRA219O171_60138 [Vibrio crassostreae]|nr:hypothetical protein VCRA219O171_60138 [Vibrio crassostreae]CAK3069706.1 hypothetical protein VCRA2120O255_60136 [Vibrio crassostreae]CDT26520.1 hypothetical protein VCR20J5_170094 [Vibrio crassostreae]CDT37030.1 hypothetical protein VCRLGP107_520116 [Vibrio crassostreae]